MKNTVELFEIKILEFEHYDFVESDEIQYMGVKFLLESLKKYNDLCACLNFNGKMTIWTREGKKLSTFYLTEDKSFKEELIKKLK